MEDKKNEENFFQKWGLIIFILLMSIGIIFSVFKHSKPSIASQYSKQAISILKDFKNTTITADEAYTKIQTLEKRVDEEKEKTDLNENEKLDLLTLGMELGIISWELLGDKNTMSSESFTISEIDEYIVKLKKY